MTTQLVPIEPGSVLETFLALKARTPADTYGFPTVVYDHNHIPHDLFERSPAHIDAIKQIAGYTVSIIEGYPSVHMNEPIWSPLPQETEVTYQAFREFLNDPHRNLAEVMHDFPHLDPETVNMLYHAHYWPERARAYDLLRHVVAARLRDQRVLITEDNHYQVGGRLIQAAIGELQQRGDRPFEGVSAADLVKIISQAVEMQRISIRLPGRGPAANAKPEPPRSGEKSLNHAIKEYEGHGEAGETEAQALRDAVRHRIASSEEEAQELQDIAIRLMEKASEK